MSRFLDALRKANQETSASAPKTPTKKGVGKIRGAFEKITGKEKYRKILSSFFPNIDEKDIGKYDFSNFESWGYISTTDKSGEIIEINVSGYHREDIKIGKKRLPIKESKENGAIEEREYDKDGTETKRNKIYEDGYIIETEYDKDGAETKRTTVFPDGMVKETETQLPGYKIETYPDGRVKTIRQPSGREIHYNEQGQLIKTKAGQMEREFDPETGYLIKTKEGDIEREFGKNGRLIKVKGLNGAVIESDSFGNMKIKYDAPVPTSTPGPTAPKTAPWYKSFPGRNKPPKPGMRINLLGPKEKKKKSSRAQEAQREMPEAEPVELSPLGLALDIDPNPGRGEKINTPTTPDEEEALQEIEGLSQEDKEQIGLGLSTLGFKVEQKKNNFFANTFNGIINGYEVRGRKIKGLGDKGTIGRFCKELANSFTRDAEEARKKGVAIQEGKDKSKFRNMSLLVGNVLKYGRIVADVTGLSIANPLRWTMMSAMGVTRGAEAGKEARLHNEEVIEKTRIQDADLAAEEAWAVYEEAQRQEGKKGDENVSAEALKNAYMAQMPGNLLERLQRPGTANSFLQKIIRKDLESSLKRLKVKMGWIGYDPLEKDVLGFYLKILSDEQIKEEKQKLLDKWKKDLEDYDRIVTQYGTVDELAMAARYAQTAGKAIVGGMQIETALVSLDKLFHDLSNMLSSHDITVDQTAEQKGIPPRAPSRVIPTPDHTPSPVPPLNTPEAHQTPSTPPGQGGFELRGDPRDFRRLMDDYKQHSGVSSAPTVLAPEAPAASDIATPNTPQGLKLNPDAIVRKGEGVTQAFAKQLKHNPDLAKELGFQGDVNNPKDMAHFTRDLAIKTGYMDEEGHEIRITEANKVAYELKVENGNPVVAERTGDGKTLEIHHKGDAFEKDTNQYEKHYSPQKPETPTSEPKTPEPIDYSKLTSNEFSFADPEEARMAEERAILETMPSAHEDRIAEIKADLDKKYDTNQESELMTDKVKALNATLSTHRGEQGGVSSDSRSLRPTIIDKVAGNPLELNSDRLRQADQIYQNNIVKFFGDKNRWGIISHSKASDILEDGQHIKNDSGVMGPAYNYLRELRKITGVKPQGNLIVGRENVEHFVARAIQHATKEGGKMLEEVRNITPAREK